MDNQTSVPGARAVCCAVGHKEQGGAAVRALRAAERAVCQTLRWELLRGTDVVSPAGRTPSECGDGGG